MSPDCTQGFFLQSLAYHHVEKRNDCLRCHAHMEMGYSVFMVKMITHLINQEAEVEKVSSMLIVSSY